VRLITANPTQSKHRGFGSARLLLLCVRTKGARQDRTPDSSQAGQNARLFPGRTERQTLPRQDRTPDSSQAGQKAGLSPGRTESRTLPRKDRKPDSPQEGQKTTFLGLGNYNLVDVEVP